MSESNFDNRHGLIYARKNLGVAVWKLATGIGDIKSRLLDAYIELALIQEADLPKDLVEDWRGILTDLTSGKMQYSPKAKGGKIVQEPVGIVPSTLRYMRKKKAEDIAKRICKLQGDLDRYTASI